MSSKIDGREYGLEFGTIALQFLFKSKALHYGYWTEDMDVEFFNLGRAQTNYTAKMVNNIPEGVKTILDVGCGTGILAKSLIEKGYEVECVSPSPFLADEVRKIIKDVVVYESKFEDLKIEKKYDLLIFSESFQYIALDQVFPLAFARLNTNGAIMLADMFKTQDDRGPIGGGYSYNRYLEVCKNNNLNLIKDIDMTKNIAPTFDIIQDLSLNFIKPFSENFGRIFKHNKPWLFKLISWKFNKKIKRFNRHFRPNRNGKGFMDYNTYRIMIWKKN